MRISPAVALGVALIAVSAAPPAYAQLSRFLESVKERATDKVAEQASRMLDPAAKPATQPEARGKLTVREASDFVPGTRVLVQHTFDDVPLGTMPKALRTNGSGQVISLDQIPGRWLSLQADALYKLNPQVVLPNRFTVQFDLLVIADSVGDLYPVKFGFAHDNSVANNRTINEVSLLYYNNDDFVISSDATKYYHSSDFDLRGYANRVMPVSIGVDGDQMRVYLDGTKIGDAQLFRGNPSRHFYLDAPSSMSNGGRLALRNLRIADFGDGAAPAR